MFTFCVSTNAGQKFAMNEEKVILSSILRRFKVTSLQSRDQLIPNGELILRSQNGIIVRLDHRWKHFENTEQIRNPLNVYSLSPSWKNQQDIYENLCVCSFWLTYIKDTNNKDQRT